MPFQTDVNAPVIAAVRPAVPAAKVTAGKVKATILRDLVKEVDALHDPGLERAENRAKLDKFIADNPDKFALLADDPQNPDLEAVADKIHQFVTSVDTSRDGSNFGEIAPHIGYKAGTPGANSSIDWIATPVGEDGDAGKFFFQRLLLERTTRKIDRVDDHQVQIGRQALSKRLDPGRNGEAARRDPSVVDLAYHCRFFEVQDARERQLQGSLSKDRKAKAGLLSGLTSAQFRKLARQVILANHRDDAPPFNVDESAALLEMEMLFGKVGSNKDVTRLPGDFVLLCRLVEACDDAAQVQALCNLDDNAIGVLVNGTAARNGFRGHAQTTIAKDFRGYKARKRTDLALDARDKMRARLEEEPAWWSLSTNSFEDNPITQDEYLRLKADNAKVRKRSVAEEKTQAEYLAAQRRGERVNMIAATATEPAKYYVFRDQYYKLGDQGNVDVANWRVGGADYRFKPSQGLLDRADTLASRVVAEADAAFSTLQDQGHQSLRAKKVKSYNSGLRVTEYEKDGDVSALQLLSEHVDKQTQVPFTGKDPIVSFVHINERASGSRRLGNSHVMIISHSGDIGEVATKRLVAPSTAKVFMSDEAFAAVEKRSHEIHGGVLKHLAQTDAIEEVVDILKMNLGDLIKEKGGLPNSPEAQALLKEIKRGEELLSLKIGDQDSPKDISRKIAALQSDLARLVGNIFSPPVSAVSPASRARIGVIESEMIRGDKTNDAINKKAEKLAPAQVQYELAMQAKEAIKHNAFKLALTPDEIGEIRKKYLTENPKAFNGKDKQADEDDFNLLLSATVSCPVDPSQGSVVIIDKPRAGKSGYLAMKGGERQWSDGRPNRASVAFVGQDGDSIAHVHIPNTHELYAQPERAVVGGSMQVYDAEGKAKTIEVKAGQVVMHGCPFRKGSDGEYKPIPLSKLSEQEKRDFKGFSVTATSIDNEGNIIDAAVLFKGKVCNLGVEKTRTTLKVFKTTSETVEIGEKTSPYGKEGTSFARLTTEFGVDDDGYIEVQPSKFTAADEAYVEGKGYNKDQLCDKQYADIGTHPGVLGNFRIVVPVYALSGGMIKTSFLKGAAPEIETVDAQGDPVRMPFTEANLATVYRGGDCQEYFQKMKAKAEDKSLSLSVIVADNDDKGERRKRHITLEQGDDGFLRSVGALESGAAHQQRTTNSCKATYAKRVSGQTQQHGQAAAAHAA